MGRYDSIDVMRAIALILMVPCHFVLFYSPYEPPYEGLYTLVNEVLGGISAPLFLFLVGMSQAISLNRKPKSDILFDETGSRLIKRAIAIFVVGVSYRILIEGSLFEWGVLTLIAASLIVFAVIRNLPNGAIIVIALFVFILAPFLREWVGYLEHWEPLLEADHFSNATPALWLDPLSDYSNASEVMIGSVLAGFFLTGYFPIFPWLCFPLIGFVVGRNYCKTKKHPSFDFRLLVFAAVVTVIGLLIALLSLNMGTANFESGLIAPFIYFPLSPSWALVQMGVCLFLFVFLKRIYDDGKVRSGVFLDYCRLISKYSLTTYVIHYLVAYWPPRLLEMLSGDDVNIIGEMVSVPASIFAAGCLLIFLYLLYKIWDHFDAKFSAEWFVKWLSK